MLTALTEAENNVRPVGNFTFCVFFRVSLFSCLQGSNVWSAFGYVVLLCSLCVALFDVIVNKYITLCALIVTQDRSEERRVGKEC